MCNAMAESLFSTLHKKMHILVALSCLGYATSYKPLSVTFPQAQDIGAGN